MADPLSPNSPFRLPQDLATLSQMRDQLGDYLSTLERNTDAVDNWLKTNNEKIIIAHHQLQRAVSLEKDQPKTLSLLKNMGDIAGFVIALQDFGMMAEDAFGKDNAFAKELAKIKPGIPEKILERLPEVKIPDADSLLPKPTPPKAPESEQKKNWWSSAGGWFSGNSEKEREEQARQEEENIRRRWRQTRDEIVSLQSDRHYYIDSFMDWVGETLSPSNPGQDVSPVMETYQSPAYVIDLAQQDYAKIVSVRADALRENARDYSLLAGLIDRQEIGAFIKILPDLFSVKETDKDKKIKQFLVKKLLLEDFGVKSFADLALTHVKDRKDQFNLYERALTLENDILLSDKKYSVFDRLLNETLAEYPINAGVLRSTLKKLRTLVSLISGSSFHPEQLINFKELNPFEMISRRFDDDPALYKAALQNLIEGLGADDNGQAAAVVSFADALKKNDAFGLSFVLNRLTVSPSAAPAFMGLWHLCYPSSSLLKEMMDAVPDTKKLAALMDKALDAGILDEFKITPTAKQGSFFNLAAFFQLKILPALDQFPKETARHLLASALATGGLNDLRTSLTQQGGWLEKTLTAQIDDSKKLEWIAALIEPYKSDITKANILAEAAKNALSPDAAQALSLLEQNLVGENVRLGDDKIMTNLGRIANIWYNPDKKIMKYTVSGIANIFMTDMEQSEADETLSLLKRRGGFEAEYSGLFNPALIDKFYTTQDGTRISWHRKNNGDLNAEKPSLDAIHSRKDFLHEVGSDGTTYSVNAKSIALVQELSDGTHLLVDKYGVAEILNDKISLPTDNAFIKIGGALFNPDNASVISLNRSSGTLEFRIESADFDDFMNKVIPDDYFYSVKVSGEAEFEKIEDALKTREMIASPGGNLQRLHFNLGALGYLMYDNSKIIGGQRDTGFNCRKYAAARKTGFIRTEKALADGILRGLKTSPDLITVEGTITHKNCIDDAFYDTSRKNLYLFIGSEYLEIPCPQQEGQAILAKLAKEKGFGVVGSNLVKNPNGAGTVEVPADVVNFARATLLHYSDAQEKVTVTAEHESFPVNLDRLQSHTLFDVLEKKGLKNAEDAAQSAPWTRDIRQELQNLPSFSVKLSPALKNLDPAYLLEQALTGSESKNKKEISLRADFSASAKTLKTNDSFDYPAEKRSRPSTSLKPKR